MDSIYFKNHPFQVISGQQLPKPKDSILGDRGEVGKEICIPENQSPTYFTLLFTGQILRFQRFDYISLF